MKKNEKLQQIKSSGVPFEHLKNGDYRVGGFSIQPFYYKTFDAAYRKVISLAKSK